MGYEKYGLSLLYKIFHNGHELFYFLRRKHGRRFIKNKNLIIPVKHLEYLNSLLHADGNIFDLCVEIYGKTISF